MIVELAKGIGLDPVAVGALKSARYLEPLAGLAAHPGEDMKWGGENIGMKCLVCSLPDDCTTANSERWQASPGPAEKRTLQELIGQT